MTFSKTLGLLGAALLALGACTETPDAALLSPGQPSFKAAAATVVKSTVARARPLAHDVTTSATVTRAGGVIELPEAGLTVVVPQNAIPAGKSALTITVTARKGRQIAYEFGPHGTQFNRPLVLTQDIRDSEWKKRGALAPLAISYFANAADLDEASGIVAEREELPAQIRTGGDQLTWNVWHFSGYTVVWGRKKTGSDSTGG